MGEPDWLNPAEMRVWRAFLAAASGVTGTLDTELKSATGIGLDDYEVLVFLSEAPDRRLRMNELSNSALHSKSRLTQRVDRLAKRGWVAREKCDTDGRGTWAVLTDVGLEVLADAAPDHLEHVRANFVSHLDPENLDTLADSLELLAEAHRAR